MKPVQPVSFFELLRDHYRTDFHILAERFTCKPVCSVQLHQTECAVGQPSAMTTAAIYLHVQYRDGGSTTLRLRYELDLRYGHERCIGPEIEVCRPNPDAPGRCDDWLLPHLELQDYLDLAVGMLRRFDPAALCRRNRLNAVAVANRMGLRIRRTCFERGSDILGRICFEPVKMQVRSSGLAAEEKLVSPYWIVLNRDLCTDPDIENSTILHECAHYYLDRAFFAVQRMAGRPFSCFCERSAVPGSRGCFEPIGRMELQAELMTAAFGLMLPDTGRGRSRMWQVFPACAWIPIYTAGEAQRKKEVTEYYRVPQFKAEPGTQARERENRRFVEDSGLWAEMREEIRQAGTLKEAVGMILNRKGISWEELALRIGVDRKTLVGWLSRKNVSTQHMICVCVGLQLRGDIGNELIRLAECRMRRSSACDLYVMMLMNAPALTVERCNEILLSGGHAPLHWGEG